MRKTSGILSIILLMLTLFPNTLCVNADGANFTQHKPWIKNLHLQTETQAQNGLVAGEGCQIISCIDASAFDPNVMIAGTDSSGAFRSTDSGTTWTFIDKGVEMWGIVDVAFDPNNSGVVYMAQSGPNDSDYVQGMKAWSTVMGIYKSTDNGESFEKVLSCCPLGASTANKLIQFDEQGNVYVLSDIGVHKSSDGETWNLIYEMTSSVVNDFYVSDDGQIIAIAGQECGLVVSDDSGTSFETKLSDPVYAIAKDPKSNYLLMSCGGDGEGLYQSSDLFANKSEIDCNKAYYGVPKAIRFSADGKVVYIVYNVLGDGAMRYSDDDMQSWKKPEVAMIGDLRDGDLGPYNEGIFTSTTSPNIVYFSFNSCIYKSVDYGQNFEFSNGHLSGIRADDLQFDSKGNLYIASMDYGLMKTTQAYSKASFPTIYSFKSKTGKVENECSVEAVGINPDNDSHILIAIGTQNRQRLMETNNGGEDWNLIESVPLSNGRYTMLEFADASTIYSTYYRSVDGGDTWLANDKAITDINTENTSKVLGIKDNKVYLSDNKGESWTELYANSYYTIQTAAFGNDGYIYIGCNYGTIIKTDGNVVKSVNIKNGLNSDMAIGAIAVNPKNQQHIVIGGSYSGTYAKAEGLFESCDGGETWNNVPGMYGMGTVFELAFTPDGDEVLASGFTGGIVAYDYKAYHNTIAEDEYITKYIEFDSTANIQTMLKATDTYQVGDNAAFEHSLGALLSYGTECESKKSVYATLNVDDLKTDDIVSAELIINRRVYCGGTLFVSSLTTGDDWTDSSGFAEKYPTEAQIPQSEQWTSKFMDYGTELNQYSIDITGPFSTALAEGKSFDTLALTYENYRSQQSNVQGTYIDVTRNNPKGMFYIKVKCKKAASPRYEYKAEAQPYVGLTARVYHNAENGAKAVQPITAVYRDGKLIYAQIEDVVSLKGGSNMIFAQYSTAKAEDKDVIKLFLWENLSTLKPVNETYGEEIGVLRNR